MFYQSMPPIGNVAGMANAEFFKGPQFDEIAMDPPYTSRERAEDQLLLRSLQKGEMGSGPLIDKAIQDLIQRTSIGGTGLRGV
jgi:tRNA G10  N-methylase Trm11